MSNFPSVRFKIKRMPERHIPALTIDCDDSHTKFTVSLLLKVGTPLTVHIAFLDIYSPLPKIAGSDDSFYPGKVKEVEAGKVHFMIGEDQEWNPSDKLLRFNWKDFGPIEYAAEYSAKPSVKTAGLNIFLLDSLVGRLVDSAVVPKKENNGSFKFDIAEEWVNGMRNEQSRAHYEDKFMSVIWVVILSYFGVP